MFHFASNYLFNKITSRIFIYLKFYFIILNKFKNLNV
jgi:hypothetical protein